MRNLVRSFISFLKRNSRMIWQSLKMGAVSAGFIALLILTGCQSRLALELNGYYPDHSGDKRVGDPRRAMFEGSGYSEDDGQVNPSSDYSRHFTDRKD